MGTDISCINLSAGFYCAAISAGDKKPASAGMTVRAGHFCYDDYHETQPDFAVNWLKDKER